MVRLVPTQSLELVAVFAIAIVSLLYNPGVYYSACGILSTFEVEILLVYVPLHSTHSPALHQDKMLQTQLSKE